MFNKVKKYILTTILVFLFGAMFSRGQIYYSIGGGNELPEGPYQKDPRIEYECNSNSTNLGDCIIIKDSGEQSIMYRLLKVFGLDNDALGGDHKFIKYVRGILNIALGLLSFVVLIMTIYTFYLMFFTENEAGIKKAKGNLVGIFIALATIGLARLIVSFIFRWYQKNWQEQGMGILGGTPQVMNYTQQNDEIYNII